jgi:predicted kinase
MCVLYIIQGFLGAGKTTHAKELARQTKAVRLNADEWCDQNFSPEQLADIWDACFSKAIEVLWKEAERLLKEKQSVILDFGFWNRSSRNYAREKASDWGIHCIHHYIVAPDDILLERLRKRSGAVAEKNIENFYTLKRLFEEPAENENAIIIHNVTQRPLTEEQNRPF